MEDAIPADAATGHYRMILQLQLRASLMSNRGFLSSPGAQGLQLRLLAVECGGFGETFCVW